jgi:hypothetical protein
VAVPSASFPPHTSIQDPVQIAVWKARPAGELVIDTAVQEFDAGS